MTRQEFDELTKDKTYDDIIYSLVTEIESLKRRYKEDIAYLYESSLFI